MKEPERDESPERWEFATWEGARKDHLRLSLTATPAQRLAMLEEMLELACRSGALERYWRERCRREG